MGSLYRPRLKTGRRCRIWWMKYYVNGRPVRESTSMAKETEARRILKEREGKVATGQPILPRAARVQYEELVADLRQHYEATGTRDLDEFARRVKHLDRFFGGRRVAAIAQVDVNAYVLNRRAEGVAPPFGGS